LQQRYRRLLDTTSRVVGQAKRFAKEISAGVKRSSDVLQQLALDGLRAQLDRMVPLVRQVMQQTRARIFRGDTRFEGKIVSVFEPSAEVIRKGKAGKPNEFGKMVKLQEAENQIIVDYEVYARRPNDADLLIPAIAAHRAKLGRVPRLVAADAAFYSGRTRWRPRRWTSSVCAFPIGTARASSATRAEEALVPQRSEMAHRMRGTHQRGQAATRSRTLPVQDRVWNAALGRAWRDLRQSHQHWSGDEPTNRLVALSSAISCFSPAAHRGGTCLAQCR
jgi:hypothetical protein